MEEFREKRERRITFNVVENLKASEKDDEIIVTTSLDPGMCGVNVLKGETWYIFSKFYDETDNTFSISICDRSIRITKRKHKRKETEISSRYLRNKRRIEMKRYKLEKEFILKNYS